jgi:glucose-1-phosphate cytidylyltransferase
MKVILLAGGLGTRISEETSDKPKPMVLLDDKPVIWHLMSIFAAQGFEDFVIATGYKGEIIAEWVASLDSPWKIEALHTGLNTQTGGRIAQCMNKFSEGRVFATYGDGLGNIDLVKLLDFHRTHNKKATVTAVRPPARFGVIESENGRVTHFGEKNQADAGWINGGFFVCQPEVFDYITEGDKTIWERAPLECLANDKQLLSYKHPGFWRPMDSLKDKMDLNELWNSGKAEWKIWK